MFDKIRGKIGKALDSRIEGTVKKFAQIFQFGSYGAVKGNGGAYMKGQKTSEAYTEEITVYGCISLIANAIASIPLRVYADDKKEKELTAHPLYKLAENPNFKDSWYDIKESVAANLEADGNAFLAVGEGKPEAVYSLCASKTKIIPSEKTTNIKAKADWIAGYEYGERKGDQKYKPDEVMHEHKFSLTDDYRGMSPICAAALNIDTMQEAKRQNFNYFVNGMHHDRVFETEQPFDQVLYDRLKDDLKNKSSGTENAHDPFILFSGLKYKSEGLLIRDMEYIAGLKMNTEQICGFIYQVPVILLGILENSSYNNISEAKTMFYEFCIKPRLVKNRELYQKLADRFGQECYVDFDLSGIDVLQEAQKDRILKAKELWGIGVSVKILNDMYKLGIPQFKGWDIGYLPFSVSPINIEPGTPQNQQGREPAEPAEPIEPPEKRIKMSKEFWTEEKKVAHWKVFDATARKYENKYKADLMPYFKAQKAEVVANLADKKSISYEKIQDNTFVFVAEKIVDGALQRVSISVDEVLFNTREQRKKLEGISKRLYKALIEERGQDELAQLTGGKSIKQPDAFNVNNPRVAEWIKENSFENARYINETMKRKLREQLVEAVNEGESIPDIEERINEVYQPYIQMDGSALERIARTETISASNEGALEAYHQGEVDKKGWLATRDARAREIGGVLHHVEMEEKYQDGIPLDEDFVNDLTGGRGEAPGMLGLAEDDINCRCTIIPIIEE